MARTDEWSSSIKDIERLVLANVHDAGQAAERLWLDTTRVRVATVKPPAIRSTWLADTVTHKDGTSVLIGWQNYSGAAGAASRRFARASEQYDLLMTQFAANLQLFRGM